jgi:two-component system phosphate regulon response regulator PhoB
MADKQGGTILVVDNDEMLRVMVTELLSARGHRVLEAEEGEGALALIRAEHPDLVLLDWNMPGMDGIDVCRAVRQDAEAAVAHTPIVMLTAEETPDRVHAAFAAGVNDYLTKPFTPARLRTCTDEWLNQH